MVILPSARTGCVRVAAGPTARIPSASGAEQRLEEGAVVGWVGRVGICIEPAAELEAAVSSRWGLERLATLCTLTHGVVGRSEEHTSELQSL